MKINPVLLMVDDDEEDVYLTKRAFTNYKSDLIFNSVADGVALFDYLDRQGKYKNVQVSPEPMVILLDINMPRENGFVILSRLKEHPSHRQLPVIMLTTSTSYLDVSKAYSLGACSYVCKSVNAAEMKKVAEKVCDYWFDFARLPQPGKEVQHELVK